MSLCVFLLPAQAALADAGDALEDANFEDQTANGAILRLTKELAWIEETLAAQGMRQGPPSTFLDCVFDNAINQAVHSTKQAYDNLLFRCGGGCWDPPRGHDCKKGW